MRTDADATLDVSVVIPVTGTELALTQHASPVQSPAAASAVTGSTVSVTDPRWLSL